MHTLILSDDISNVWFTLVWFYGVSTIVGYLPPDTFYTHVSNI